MNQKKYRDISRNKTTQNLFPLDEALGKGTLFKNIYVPYKVDPLAPIPGDEKERLLLEMQMYALAVQDIGLYLDVEPNHKEAVEIYHEYLEKLKKANDEYESKYGTLTKTSQYVNGYPWQWDKNNWPWMMEDEYVGL